MCPEPTSPKKGLRALMSNKKAQAEQAARVIQINDGIHHKEFKGNYVSTTKYNIITYLPKALFEQYRRVANIYFTLVAALSTTSLSPVRPVTEFLPLAIVLGISMLKELIEDVKRYRADREVNSRSVECFDNATKNYVAKAWRHVKVGEIVKVEKDGYFPADILLLSTSSEDGICYVETINLDGESNLKIKKALDATKKVEATGLPEFRAEVQCEQPNASLYTFTGNLVLGPPFLEQSTTLPLTPASVVLRGCSLRNTGCITGAVIFAGHDTKVMQNASLPPSKRSRIEKQMDVLILIMFTLLFILCIIGAVILAIWTKTRGRSMWYLRPDNTERAYDPNHPIIVGVYSFITSFMLYSYLIPISLYVSLEMVKVFQSMVFINSDRSMYHAASDTPALARTSNLNEELGMVNTILSDKTGTLTRNIMEFFKCSVGGIAYGQGVTESEKANSRRLGQATVVAEDGEAATWKEASFNFYDKRLLGGAWMKQQDPELIKQFCRILAVCHTAIPDGPDDPAHIKFEAESPDESALVVAAKVMGFFCYKRTNTAVYVRESVDGQQVDLEFEILNILEFDSTRKRMSTIVRSPEGKIMLFCKGADTVIYERLDHSSKANMLIKDSTRQHMEEFGAAGLRTLCLSYAQLDEEVYDAWQVKYFAAKTSLTGREEKLAEVSELIEKNLILVGCTAIEDKLQEGVPECIEHLANAGIRIWILTGDKQETAINIGFACSLLRNDMRQYIISANLAEVIALEDAGKTAEAYSLAHSRVGQQLQEAEAHILSMAHEDGDSALIIDGKALSHGLATDLRAQLLSVGGRCASVVCCRVSPKQKAQVTALVKSRGDTTLGIGDGANDVGMIMEAHIGVGISGQEGMQAVMSSDFAIAQFRYLETLLLVHGRWSYLRIARMVGYFLYKNLFFGLTIFLYNAFCFFSGQVIYNDFYMSLYNVGFTVLPPLVVGIFDQDVSKDLSRRYPGLYQAGPKNLCFSYKSVAFWLANAFLHAGILFTMVILGTKSTYIDRSSGMTYTHWEVGTIMFTTAVFTVHLQLAAMLTYWTPLHHVGIYVGCGFWLLYLWIYGSFPIAWSLDIYHMLRAVLAPLPSFWLIIVLVPITCVLPSFMLQQVARHVRPDDKTIIAEIQSKIRKGEMAKPRLHSSLAGVDSARRLSRLQSKRMSINSGFVPDSSPGASSYFSPQGTEQGTNETFEVLFSAQRNPVIAGLDAEIARNPFRHRSRSSSFHSAASPHTHSALSTKDRPSLLRNVVPEDGDHIAAIPGRQAQRLSPGGLKLEQLPVMRTGGLDTTAPLDVVRSSIGRQSPSGNNERGTESLPGSVELGLLRRPNMSALAAGDRADSLDSATSSTLESALLAGRSHAGH
ncbi:hypothetical protein WJX84_000818 [Apatococcus fuscideae]|uniref:Phospholipid-transporting ATPase n=1 Tax=Apatococcus fuscideae TaxID=2026836 RepID=A0AAW1T5C2_9CHLO